MQSKPAAKIKDINVFKFIPSFIIIQVNEAKTNVPILNPINLPSQTDKFIKIKVHVISSFYKKVT